MSRVQLALRVSDLEVAFYRSLFRVEPAKLSVLVPLLIMFFARG